MRGQWGGGNREWGVGSGAGGPHPLRTWRGLVLLAALLWLLLVALLGLYVGAIGGVLGEWGRE